MPALNDDDLKKLRKALVFLAGKSPEDRSNRLYYMGRQVLTHMGLAVPAAMRQLEVVINWPRVVVDTIEERQDVKSILVPQDEGAADTTLNLSFPRGNATDSFTGADSFPSERTRRTRRRRSSKSNLPHKCA